MRTAYKFFVAVLLSLLLLFGLTMCLPVPSAQPTAVPPGGTAAGSEATATGQAAEATAPASTVTPTAGIAGGGPVPTNTATLPATAAPTAAPTQPLSPTATIPAALPTATTPARSITIELPSKGALISSPVHVRGHVTVSPFEATLRGRVYNSKGQVIGEGPVMVQAEMGQPGDFDGQIAFLAGTGGAGRVEIAELSAKDGAVIVAASVDVQLAAGAQAGAVEVPAAGARAMLPLHIMAWAGQPGQEVDAVLRWQDGTELKQRFTTLQGKPGLGLLITSLDWNSESQPPQPGTQPARLEIRNTGGTVLAGQDLIMVAANDPDTQQITLYFVGGDQVQAIQRRVLKTQGIGKAALEELLWGPTPGNLAGFTTALPTPQEVLSYPGRQADWGPRVTLRGLTIVNGTATANFSREFAAYGGGSLRVKLITDQITQTLKQFSTVQQVVIAVEGQTQGVLEP